MKVFIFGSNGMMGYYLTEYLKDYFSIIPITRNEIDLNDDFSLILKKYKFKKNDLIINAAGIIKQRNYSAEELIRVNSLFPHFLSKLKCNVIHITTDCVFNGKVGSYNEDSKHDCLDDYGKSKSLGENENLTIIRTSIIGEELYNKKSLIEWVKTNQNTTISGYLNHFWNGVTCLELSKQIKNIIDSNSYWRGVRHYFSPDTVSKYQLVSYINDVYELNNQVNPVMTDYCDRSLSTNYSSPIKKIIKDQIIELREFDSKRKLKNFPTLNFISIPESEDRRKVLSDECEKYKIKTFSHIYERYKSGDSIIDIGDYSLSYAYEESYFGAFTSHFKAIKEWYETTDEQYAFFCEDDVSFETVKYWNFTWEEFFNKLPSTWQCIQLSLTRSENEMFRYFQPEVHLRPRCWDDWSCVSYLITRDYAKKLIDTYHNSDNAFNFSGYKGIDYEGRPEWSLRPIIENYLYTNFDEYSVFSFPLFVQNNNFDTVVWDQSGNTRSSVHEYSYDSIMNWWKNVGKNSEIKCYI